MGHDEQVGESFTVQTEEGLDAFGLPFFAQGTPASAGDHVEGGGGHPLKTGRIDQAIEYLLASSPTLNSAGIHGCANVGA